MPQTTVSRTYRVHTPKGACDRAGLKPGDKLDVTATCHVIRLARIPTLEELRGIARGTNTEHLRDKEDRL
jgi:bifunctional DNA-binding transcriptional regulator/antitoxin component of YhaV-PrlF toxin-antitoxin module